MTTCKVVRVDDVEEEDHPCESSQAMENVQGRDADEGLADGQSYGEVVDSESGVTCRAGKEGDADAHGH